MSDTRLFFAALPPPEVVAAIRDTLRKNKLDHGLGRALFAPENWHQSLSGRRFNATREDVSSLRAVGGCIRARACTLQCNRIETSVTNKGRIYMTLRAKGKPKPLELLNLALQTQLRAAEYEDMATGVTAHTTVSYDAPGLIERIVIEPSIAWTINEFLLLLGNGDPYRYDVIDRWQLLPERDPIVTQTSLF